MAASAAGGGCHTLHIAALATAQHCILQVLPQWDFGPGELHIADCSPPPGPTLQIAGPHRPTLQPVWWGPSGPPDSDPQRPNCGTRTNSDLCYVTQRVKKWRPLTAASHLSHAGGCPEPFSCRARPGGSPAAFSPQGDVADVLRRSPNPIFGRERPHQLSNEVTITGRGSLHFLSKYTSTPRT